MNTEKHIFLNQSGYLPEMEKKAIINIPAKYFEIINDNNEICYSGKISSYGYDCAAGEKVWHADFSKLTAKGSYRLRLDNKECSYRFEISHDVYKSSFDAALKAFYYLRCGCGLDPKHAGVFKHESCHTERALVWDDRSISADVTGGWHDAGDYGRYVTAGACALAHLLYAYKLYPAVFKKQNLNIPESGGSEPDILAECRVELDWIMKMQRNDGAVYHKATTAGHAPFIMPEDDRAQMFLLPPSSMAAADTAAVLALASGIYAEYDKMYAEKLLNASLKSYEWLERNPDYLFENRSKCTTGGYGEHDDRDNRFWAAAELFALTGEEKYHNTLISLSKEHFSSTGLGYADIGGLGSLAYILSGKGREDIVSSLKEAFSSHAERIVLTCGNSGYCSSLAPEHYGWGSNMGLLKNGMILLLADRFQGTDKFEKYAAAQLHYLLGANATGYSYISGIGEHSINFPHLRPAHADGIELCIPGMVSGGANKYLSDPDAKLLIPEGTPPMKCFADDYRCYSLNEITIYWNSPAVFLLAHFNS